MDNFSGNINALAYQFPFLKPNSSNSLSNLQISLTLQLLNISESCDQVNTTLISCSEVILYSQIITFGYVNIDATEYTMYIGDKNDICQCDENGFIVYSTTINNTSLNSKIYMGIITFEFLNLLDNVDGPSHIKFTIWKGAICPAQVTRINVIKLRKHKTLVMKITPDIIQDGGAPAMREDSQFIYPTSGEIQFAKSLLASFLHQFEWNMLNFDILKLYNAKT
jgi:hypothetical protein